MTNDEIDKLLTVYEENTRTLNFAIKASGGMGIPNNDYVREFLRTLAKNQIELTATYTGTKTV